MEKTELLRRIEKKENDITKKERNLVKYVVNDEFTAICDRYFKTNDRTELNQYKEKHNLFCLPEYYGKRYDLEEAKKTLAKYQVELNKVINFENEEKIPALVEFLKMWRELAYNWYLENAKEYFNLKKNYRQAFEEWKNSIPAEDYRRDKDGKINWRYENRFEDDYYSSINKLTEDIIRIKSEYFGEFPNRLYLPVSYTVNTDELNKWLDKEVKAKYQDLVHRVTKVTGTIKDASNLRVANNGSINGIIIGETAKAKMETIMAGGYNIQCLHYRVLVNKINN